MCLNYITHCKLPQGVIAAQFLCQIKQQPPIRPTRMGGYFCCVSVTTYLPLLFLLCESLRYATSFLLTFFTVFQTSFSAPAPGRLQYIAGEDYRAKSHIRGVVLFRSGISLFLVPLRFLKVGVGFNGPSDSPFLSFWSNCTIFQFCRQCFLFNFFALSSSNN